MTTVAARIADRLDAACTVAAVRRLASLVLAAVLTAGTLGAIDGLAQVDAAAPAMAQKAAAGTPG